MFENLEKEELIQIIEKLKKENKDLKEQLHGKVEKEEKKQELKNISSDEKVKIFMEVFHGRNDLYAMRKFSSNNK